MRDSLLWRLLSSHILVIAIAVVISGVLITNLASRSFMTIMAHYHIEPVMVEREFHTATREILVGSSVVATASAMFSGWVLVRRLVRPLERMMLLAEDVAQGDYRRRVNLDGPRELVRLADALNRMADSLHRVEALRRDLVANVAHELRTPLSTLLGYLEAMRDGLAAPSPETLASLHEEVLRLVRLVGALHQLSQFDARISRLHLTDVDLAALARRLADIRRPEFARRGMTVRLVGGAGASRVRADADLIDQALRNLLDNALRYAPDGADVVIETSRLDGATRVAVSNTGEGIAREDLPHIFERFYRGDKSRSRDGGGAGIGLALVLEIAREHGGDVGAACADGTTMVWFTLPVRADGASMTVPRAVGALSLPGRRSRGWREWTG